MLAVDVRGLVKRYGEARALDGVTFTVSEGEIHGLLGPNGAGKTTLLRLLFGLVAADAGSIELLGRPIQAAEGRAGGNRLHDVAGFVEDPTFYPYLTGRGNLELLARLDDGPAQVTIDEVLQRVGLAARGGDKVSGYSTGMRQRLGVAAALLRSPRLLLLDEPTSGLDPAGARAVAQLLRELAGQGVAILLSSHLLSGFESVCDAFTVIRQGRVVWSGTLDRLRDQAPESAYALATSDDDEALRVASARAGVGARRVRGGGLAVSVDPGALDGLVLALGAAGIAVRRLELLVSPLESMFFALTGEAPADEEIAPAELAERALARA